MCGIVGAAARRDIVPVLVEGLRRLEYRGYDSCGVAVLFDGQIGRVRSVARVADLAVQVGEKHFGGATGIAHTRWATHGAPATENAHPLVSHGEIALVHNGIIENHEELRAELQAAGYRFESQTDTEVIAHLVHSLYRGDLAEAVRAAVKRLAGAYAIAVLASKEPHRVVGARSGSPLVVGVGQKEFFLASDALALAGTTERIPLPLERPQPAYAGHAGVAVGRNRRYPGGAEARPGAGARQDARRLQCRDQCHDAHDAARLPHARRGRDRRRLDQGLQHAADRPVSSFPDPGQGPRAPRCRRGGRASQTPAAPAHGARRGARARAAGHGVGRALREERARAVSRPRAALPDRARGGAEAEGSLLYPRRSLRRGRAEAWTARAGHRGHARSDGGTERRAAREAQIEHAGSEGARRRAVRVRRCRHAYRHLDRRERGAPARALRPAVADPARRAAAAPRLPRGSRSRHRRR